MNNGRFNDNINYIKHNDENSTANGNGVSSVQHAIEHQRREAAIRKARAMRALRIKLIFLGVFIAVIALFVAAIVIVSSTENKANDTINSVSDGNGSSADNSLTVIGRNEITENESESETAKETTARPRPSYTADPGAITVIRPDYTDESVTLATKIDCKYAVLVDLNTNTVLASKNSTKRMYPASMTKIMTLIVACENITDLNDEFTFTWELLNPLYNKEASMAGFSAGETVTVKDLLYGAILPSGADSTCALAEYIAGSEAEFVKMMNDKAEEMGLTNTNFMNTSGLHHINHYSTVVEVAMILDYAMQNELCKEILSTYRYTTTATDHHPEGIMLESTMFGRMFGDEAEGVTVIAGKTGYTNEGLHCLASYGEEDDGNGRYICVCAYGETRWEPIYDSIEIYSDYK